MKMGNWFTIKAMFNNPDAMTQTTEGLHIAESVCFHNLKWLLLPSLLYTVTIALCLILS